VGFVPASLARSGSTSSPDTEDGASATELIVSHACAGLSPGETPWAEDVPMPPENLILFNHRFRKFRFIHLSEAAIVVALR